MGTTKAHCNTCGGNRNHEVVHSETTSWSDDDHNVSGSDTYETLKCLGCENIKLRHTSWFSEEPESAVNYFPPAIFRPRPKWMEQLWIELPAEDGFVDELLKEIYVAIHNNLRSLAAMGVRSLVEKVMISKAGDKGSFLKNIAEFERLGYVSRIQRERIEAILEAGHAAIHRDFRPTTKDVITLVDIAEHIVETVYLHESKVNELRKRVPPRIGKP
ncbi:hypothetical protein R69888_00075 [Paraburkholderia haematera]|uniref:DUF4145 domain-containing protein n=2 Tax=Paraburkholderia haematera TaxID=2793077 RepID=A0ABN7KE58_9BURK|nr:hypothetical protein R69888_00075 [Paraburkholderia haematera]